MKKLYLLFLLCSIELISFAQTIAINPTGDGGFETGTTFPANGWTVVNSAANQWAVGTGSVFSGTNGAYIGTPTMFVGSNTVAVNHFYRDITIPAGATNVQLTFQYKQPIIDFGFDSLYVATTTTANTPVANVQLGAGYTRIYYNTAISYSSYTTVGPINLTSLAGTTVRLVFTHRNDGMNPIGVPAVDNISLTYCDNITGGAAAICPGNTTTLANTAPTGTWTSSSSSIATINASGLVTGISAGTAAITYTSGTCVVTKIVTVSPVVVPSVSMTTSSAGGVCEGTATTFTANPVNGGSTPFYQWSVNGAAVLGAGNIYTYIPANGDVIRAKLTAAGGVCPSPDTASVSYVATTIPSLLPSVTTTITPGNHVCTGIPVGFTATGTNGGTTPTYKWSKNGVYVATGPSYYSALANGDVIKAVMFSNYPCRLADSVLSAGTTMAVETPTSAPTVSIISTPGYTITAGQADTFIAVAAGGSTSPLYQWYVNSIPVSGATNAMFVTNTLTNGNIVSCKVSNTDFCGASIIKSTVVTVSAVSVLNNARALENFTIIPNPSHGEFIIRGNGSDVTATVTNMVGQTVYTEKLITANNSIEQKMYLTDLPAGVYILSLNTQGSTKVLRFVIEK